MLLSVHDMELHKVTFDVTYEPDRLDLTDAGFRQRWPVRIQGTAELTEGTQVITVRGHITGALEGECHRCLDPRRLELDSDFELKYRPRSMLPTEPELELDDKEIQFGFYEGEGIELLDVLMEQIMLWLPMHWLCREDCRGLCPICGENRNHVECHCKVEDIDPRWSALKALKLG